MSQNLIELRKKIDELDARWLAVLAERFKVTREVGKLKATSDMPPKDPKREAEQRQRIDSLSAELGLPKSLASDLLSRLQAEVVKEHEQLKK